MACCALAAWILGSLIRPFAALGRRQHAGQWAPPARWVPGVGTADTDPQS
jgi:hypothetical protein